MTSPSHPAEASSSEAARRKIERILTVVSIILLVEFIVIPVLWATGKLEGPTFWIAQAIFVATLGATLVVIRRLKETESRS